MCVCVCVYLSVVMQDRGNESSDWAPRLSKLSQCPSHACVCVFVCWCVCLGLSPSAAINKCVRKHELVPKMRTEYGHVQFPSFSPYSTTYVHVHTRTHTYMHALYAHSVRKWLNLSFYCEILGSVSTSFLFFCSLCVSVCVCSLTIVFLCVLCVHTCALRVILHSLS